MGTAPWGRNMTLENVITNPLPGKIGSQGVNGGDPGLELRVSAGEPRGGAVRSGEVATARRDMKYGSFRAGIKYTGQNGTCGAFFFVSSLGTCNIYKNLVISHPIVGNILIKCAVPKRLPRNRR